MFSGNTGTSISTDTTFTPASTFTNIEAMDIRSLTLNTADNNTEFNFTEAMIKQWTGSQTGTLSLTLSSSQAEKIMFTDTTNTVHDTSATIQNSFTYDLRDDDANGSITHLSITIA